MADHLRELAVVLATDSTEPATKLRDGVVVAPITATHCHLYLNGDTSGDIDGEPIGPVRYEAHVAPLVAGDVVRVTFTGASLRVTGRLAK